MIPLLFYNEFLMRYGDAEMINEGCVPLLYDDKGEYFPFVVIKIQEGAVRKNQKSFYSYIVYAIIRMEKEAF